ncbi:MAG: hypothetical protein JWN40_3712 [Phycisphaerales bacterium]|nr:hypothetical protein [Phycisphaerales bacterium]
MFGWLKRRRRQSSCEDGVLVTHAPMKVFPWPKGAAITAVEELVLALPVALFEKDRPMSEFVFGPDDMQINIPAEGDVFFIQLMPGMSVSLAKSCQAYIIADDQRLRRLKVTRPPAER